MNFIGRTFETNVGSILKVVSILGKDNGSRKIYGVECSICSKDVELFPEPIPTYKSRIIKGIIPCGCSKSHIWNIEQYHILVSRKCKDLDICFIGFYDFNGNKTKVNCVCKKCNEHLNKSTIKGILKGTGCRNCSFEKLSTINRKRNTDKIIKTICDKHGYTFEGYVGGVYVNAKTKLKIFCPFHKDYMVDYRHFVNTGVCCPNCHNGGGYRSEKPGYFYVYRYDNGQDSPVYKYGITNRTPEERSLEHIKEEFLISKNKIVEIYFDNGIIPRLFEKYIKDNYETGVCSWLVSGNTETVCAKNNDFEKDIEHIHEKIMRDYLEY